MTINTPEDLVKAINSMLLQMNRPQRKQFLLWVKRRRKEYDFTYPEGWKFKEEANAEQGNTVESVVTVPDAPVIVTPEPGIIIPDSAKASS